jgi:GT2 family glycosyltransferase
MSEVEVVFIYPIIRTDFIQRSLYTLFKYTDKKKFRIIVIDQSMEGLSSSFVTKIASDGMYIRQKNQGFSNAANKGIIQALKWNVPYISVVNDDTEFMYAGWWEDLLEEFKTDPKIVAVCPESPRVAMWGYGLNHGEHVEIIPHKEEFTKEDIDFLKKGDYFEREQEIRLRHPFEIPQSFPFTKRGIVDGIAMWCPVFKREAFIRLGLFEEKFVWGGGEDYDMLARAYSCAYPIAREECVGRDNPEDLIHHQRMVSTMKSWVWHWWGQSKDVKQTLDPRLFEGKKPWNNLGELWSPRIDVWGHPDGKPCKRLIPVTS